MMNLNLIREHDPIVADYIDKEIKRQQYKIELIASENFTSEVIMETMGSPLTNKYAEGYPAKRYYGGCEHVDEVEKIAIERLKKIFGADHANVQPHSGAQANLAVYFGVLEHGDTILGMDLSQGGHLTHGSPVNLSGKSFNIVPYCVDKKTETINYDELRDLAIKHKPKMILAGASAYPRKLDFKIFKDIADEVGAYFMADIAHIAGLVAAGIHQSPVPYADFVTSTTHKTLRGPRGGIILCKEKYKKVIDKAVFPGMQGGPLMHIIAAKAVSFKEIMKQEFIDYQKQIVNNAMALADELKLKGFNLVSGGTDNHLMLVNLSNMNLTGKEAQIMLDEYGITTNKNSIPYDEKSPFVTSGIRIGTPAVTTRGMKEEDMKEIADIIYITLTKFESSKKSVKERVEKLCKKYPLYEKYGL